MSLDALLLQTPLHCICFHNCMSLLWNAMLASVGMVNISVMLFGVIKFILHLQLAPAQVPFHLRSDEKRGIILFPCHLVEGRRGYKHTCCPLACWQYYTNILTLFLPLWFRRCYIICSPLLQQCTATYPPSAICYWALRHIAWCLILIECIIIA